MIEGDMTRRRLRVGNLATVIRNGKGVRISNLLCKQHLNNSILVLASDVVQPAITGNADKSTARSNLQTWGSQEDEPLSAKSQSRFLVLQPFPID